MTYIAIGTLGRCRCIKWYVASTRHKKILSIRSGTLIMCVYLCAYVCVCVFESLPVKEGDRECVHCTLSQ